MIVWAYGMMGPGREDSIKAAIGRLNAEGDDNLYYFALDCMKDEEGIGSLGHPTIVTNINRSISLVAFLSEKMGWKYTLKPQQAAQLSLVSKHNK